MNRPALRSPIAGVPESAWVLLLSIASTGTVEVIEDTLAIPCPVESNAGIAIIPTDLDMIERDMKWVVIEEDGPRITESGRHWLLKWLRANRRALKVKGHSLSDMGVMR